MHPAGKVSVKTYLKAIKIPFFPICGISQFVIFLSNRRVKFKLLELQGHHPPPQFPCLVGYPDLPIRKTLRVVGLLTLMILFQSKKFTAFDLNEFIVDNINYLGWELNFFIRSPRVFKILSTKFQGVQTIDRDLVETSAYAMILGNNANFLVNYLYVPGSNLGH